MKLVNIYSQCKSILMSLIIYHLLTTVFYFCHLLLSVIICGNTLSSFEICVICCHLPTAFSACSNSICFHGIFCHLGVLLVIFLIRILTISLLFSIVNRYLSLPKYCNPSTIRFCFTNL